MGRNDLEKPEATNRLMRKNRNSNSSQFQNLGKGNGYPAWLPDGWNVDFKTRKTGVRLGARYKCYIDPLHGYKFYSKPEVLRYLKTVRGNNCTFMKGKGCTAEQFPTNLSSAAKRQKLKHSAIKQQLFAGKVSGEGFIESSDAYSSEEGQNVKKSAEYIDTHVMTYDAVVKMHLPKEAAGMVSEIKESNPVNVKDKNYNLSLLEKANEENCFCPSISKNKKESNVPHRFLGQHAGTGPDQLTNSVTHEPACQVSKRNLRKTITTIDVDLKNKSSQQLNVVPEGECAQKMHVELLSQNCNSPEIEIVLRDQPRQLGTEIIDDKKPRLQYSQSQDSSAPSLKIEMKTMAGELPALDVSHTDQCLASEANDIEENKSSVSQIGKSDASEIHVNLNKYSTKKDHCNPCRRSSKRLAGLEPEVVTNSIVCKRAPEYKNRRFKGKAKAVLQQTEGGLALEVADNASSYANVPLSGVTSNKSQKSPEIPPITHEQPEKHGNEEIDYEKSEPQPSIAFHYSWSDPCLEFAIKTLTGVLPIEDSIGNGPNLATEAVVSETTRESSSDRNLQVNLKRLKSKKGLGLPRRLSRRLSGYEPEIVPALRALEYAARKSCKDKSSVGKGTDLTVDASDSLKSTMLDESLNKSEKSYEAQNVPKDQWQMLETERIDDNSLEPQICLLFGMDKEDTLHASDSSETRELEETSNKNEKSCETQTVEELNRSVTLYEAQTIPMVQPQKPETDVSFEKQLCLPVAKETESTRHASSSLETRLLEDTSNKSEKSCEAQTIEELLYEDQTVLNEQQQKPEAEKLGDVMSESQLYSTSGNFWSDPCLEFAIKTLTGALPVDATADIFPVTTPDTSDLADNELPEGVVKSMKDESHDNLNQSQNNEFMTPNLFFQPLKQLEQTQLRTCSTFCQNHVSCSEEADLTRNFGEGESLCMEDVNTSKLVRHRITGSTSIHEDLSNKIPEVLDVEAVPSQQPQLETEIMSCEKPEAQFCYPFMDSWSDPSLEFAVKTLTGAITTEEDLPIQGFLEETAVWHGQRDSYSTLPDFGSTSFSQSDISSYYNMEERSIPEQQPEKILGTEVDP